MHTLTFRPKTFAVLALATQAVFADIRPGDRDADCSPQFFYGHRAVNSGAGK